MFKIIPGGFNMSSITYEIVRFYKDENKNQRIIKSGLTKQEAQEHCNDPDTRQEGIYFDGFREE